MTTYYQIESMGVKFASCHTRKYAEQCAKQFWVARINEVTEDSEGFIPPCISLELELDLLDRKGF